MADNTLAEIFKCGDLTAFVDCVKEILNVPGASGSMFFRCKVNGVQFVTKLRSPVLSKEEIYKIPVVKNAMNASQAEVKIMKLIRQHIIAANLTPCYAELLYSRKCARLTLPEGGGRIADEILRRIEDHASLVKAKLAEPYMNFSAIEYCDMTLYQFLVNSAVSPVTNAIIKSVVFHVLFAIHVTMRVWPTFKHGDLHAENIMIKINHGWEFSREDPEWINYEDRGINYTVPYFGMLPKIIDFDRASISELGVESALPLGIFEQHDAAPHPSTYLFMGLSHDSKFPAIAELLEALDPTKSYLETSWGKIRLHNKNIPGIADMIANPVWDKYRHPPRDSRQNYITCTPYEP